MFTRWHKWCWLALVGSACTLNPQPYLPGSADVPGSNASAGGSALGATAGGSAAGSSAINPPGSGGSGGSGGDAGANSEAGANGEAGADAMAGNAGAASD